MTNGQKIKFRKIIKNLLRQKKDVENASFLMIFKDILSEINDSVNSQAEVETVTVSNIEKETFIIEEFEKFCNKEIKKFYLNTDQRDTKMESEDESDNDEDVTGECEATDDPNGPNW